MHRVARILIRSLLPAVVGVAGLAPAMAGAQAAPGPVADGLPAGTFAIVRRDDGSIFSAIDDAQYERFFGAALAQAQQVPLADTVPLTPPRFTACAAPAAREWVGRGNRPRTRAARRAACERKYLGVRNTAAQQLLNLTWINAETDRRRMVFTERRIARELRTIADDQFKGQRGLRRFLRNSGLNAADVRLNVVAQLGQTAIVRQLEEGIDATGLDEMERIEAQQEAINIFRTTFLRESPLRTDCAAGYAALPACSDTPPS